MSESFENVAIIKKANVYFNGKVTSRSVLLLDGSRKTLGYMQPGQYEFDAEAPELMEILGGNVEVKLEGSEQWVSYGEGSSFRVPGHSSFAIVVTTEGADYCCSYLKEEEQNELED